MSNIKNILKLSKYFIKKEFFYLIFTITFISFFDLLTVSLLLTVMNQLTSNSSADLSFGITFLKKIFDSDLFESRLLEITFIIFIFSFLFQYLFRIFRVYLMNRVLINYNLFFIKNLSNLKFLDFRKKKMSEIFNIFNTYSDRIVNHVLDSSMTIIAGSVVALILTLPLIILNSTSVIVVTLFLIIFFYLIFQFFKKIIFRAGKNQLESEKLKSFYISYVYNFFSQIKSSIFFKNMFIENFLINIKKFYKSNLIGLSIIYLPKFLTELLIIIFIFYSFLKFNSDFTDIIPEFTIYLFIFYKLFPHMILMNTCFKRIKLANPFISNALKEIDFLKKNSENFQNHPQFKINKNILLKKIDFKFNKKQIKRIKFDNIVFEKNKKYLLMGKSGSGKSTFSYILSGLIYRNNFEIFCDDKLVVNKNISGYRKLFSVYDGRDFLIPGSVIQNIALSNEIDHKLLKKILSISGINKLLDKRLFNKTFKIEENGQNISSGQKQLICIARALYQNKDFIILDEPTSHLDYNSTFKLIKSLIRIKNKTIIIVTHNQSIKKYFDHILIFNKFKVNRER